MADAIFDGVDAHLVLRHRDLARHARAPVATCRQHVSTRQDLHSRRVIGSALEHRQAPRVLRDVHRVEGQAHLCVTTSASKHRFTACALGQRVEVDDNSCKPPLLHARAHTLTARNPGRATTPEAYRTVCLPPGRQETTATCLATARNHMHRTRKRCQSNTSSHPWGRPWTLQPQARRHQRLSSWLQNFVAVFLQKWENDRA